MSSEHLLRACYADGGIFWLSPTTRPPNLVLDIRRGNIDNWHQVHQTKEVATDSIHLWICISYQYYPSFEHILETGGTWTDSL